MYTLAELAEMFLADANTLDKTYLAFIQWLRDSDYQIIESPSSASLAIAQAAIIIRNLKQG